MDDFSLSNYSQNSGHPLPPSVAIESEFGPNKTDSFLGLKH